VERGERTRLHRMGALISGKTENTAVVWDKESRQAGQRREGRCAAGGEGVVFTVCEWIHAHERRICCRVRRGGRFRRKKIQERWVLTREKRGDSSNKKKKGRERILFSQKRTKKNPKGGKKRGVGRNSKNKPSEHRSPPTQSAYPTKQSQ